MGRSRGLVRTRVLLVARTISRVTALQRSNSRSNSIAEDHEDAKHHEGEEN